MATPRSLPTRYDVTQEAKFRRLPGRRMVCFIQGACEVLFGDAPLPQSDPGVNTSGYERMRWKPYERASYEDGKAWAHKRLRHANGEYA